MNKLLSTFSKHTIHRGKLTSKKQELSNLVMSITAIYFYTGTYLIIEALTIHENHMLKNYDFYNSFRLKI